MITKIKEMYLVKLNNAEYTNFMGRVHNELKVATIEKVGVSMENFTLLGENIKKMQDLVSQSRISDITARLDELESSRDDIVIYIMTEIANKRRTPLANIKEAATSLYNATKQYVGIQELPYQQETQQINGLLLDCNKPDNAGNVTTLGLEEILTELKRVNDEYESLTAERTNSEVKKRIDNSKTVRAENDALYDNIATMAFVTSVATPSPEASRFVVNINALIDETNTRYNQRV